MLFGYGKKIKNSAPPSSYIEMDELSATIVNPAQSFSISNPHANEDWNSQIIEGQRLVSDASDEITIFQNPMFQRDLSHKTGYRREKKVIILFFLLPCFRLPLFLSPPSLPLPPSTPLPTLPPFPPPSLPLLSLPPSLPPSLTPLGTQLFPNPIFS